MWQSCRPKHQRPGNRKDVEHGFVGLGVFLEAEIRHDSIQLRQHRDVFSDRVADKAKLRHRIAGNDDRHENRGHGISENQDAILGDLRIGHTLHPAEHGIEEHDDHADDDPDIEVDTEET